MARNTNKIGFLSSDKQFIKLRRFISGLIMWLLVLQPFLMLDFTLTTYAAGDLDHCTVSPPTRYMGMDSGSVTFSAFAFDTNEEEVAGATFDISVSPNFGIALIVGNRATYTPNASYVGTDQFTIRATSGAIQKTAIATIIVNALGMTIAPDDGPTALEIGGSGTFDAIPDFGAAPDTYTWAYSDDYGSSWNTIEPNNSTLMWVDIPTVDNPGEENTHFLRCIGYESGDLLIAKIIDLNIDYSPAVDVGWEVPAETAVGLEFDFSFYLIDQYSNTIMTEETFQGYDDPFDYTIQSYVASMPMGPLPNFTFDETTGLYSGVSELGEFMIVGNTVGYGLFGGSIPGIDFSPEVYVVSNGVYIDTPSNSTEWSTNTAEDIVFRAGGDTTPDFLKIYYSHDSGSNWIPIDTSVSYGSQPQTYSWDIPNNINNAGQQVFQIKVESHTNATGLITSGTSDLFIINQEGGLGPQEDPDTTPPRSEVFGILEDSNVVSPMPETMHTSEFTLLSEATDFDESDIMQVELFWSNNPVGDFQSYGLGNSITVLGRDYWSWDFDTESLTGNGMYFFYSQAIDNADSPNVEIIPKSWWAPSAQYDASTRVEVIRPIIHSTIPRDKDIDVAINTRVRAVFDEAMDTASVESAFSVEKLDGTPVDLDWTSRWYNEDKTVVFIPATGQYLSYETEYRVFIDPTIAKSQQGTSLDTESRVPNPWTFTTAEQQTPDLTTSYKEANRDETQPGQTIVYTIRLTNSHPNAFANVTFEDPIPHNTIYDNYIRNADWDEENNKIVWSGVINPGRTRIIRFRVKVIAPLLNGTIITNEARFTDGINNWISRYAETIIQSPPAHITLTNPMAGEENVSITPNIRVVFDQTMDRASVENAFRVTEVEGIDLEGGETTVPWNEDWGYRKKITVNKDQVSGSLDNYPVLVNGTSSAWRYIDSGGHVAKANGGDIMFTTNDGVTKLNHELSSYNPYTGELSAWIKLDNISSAADTDIYMYYGKSNADDQWNVAGTWNSNYKLVQHLDETSGIHLDSTVNNNFGDIYGNVNQDVVGQIAGADEFNGGDIRINYGSSLDLSDQMTFAGWIKADNPGGGWQTIVAHSPVAGQYNYWFYLQNNDLRLASYSSTYPNLTANNVINDNNWHHVAFTAIKGGALTIYVDGVAVASGTAGSSFWTGGSITVSDLRIGRNIRFDGMIDDIKLLNIAESGNWVTTQYNNQVNPNNFYTSHGEESLEDAPTTWLATWSSRDRRVDFTPVGGRSLNYLTEYEVEIDPDIARTAKGGVLEAGEIPNPWTFTTAKEQVPDLTASYKDSNRDMVEAGSTIVYTIRVENNGDKAATTSFVDMIPENTTYDNYIRNAIWDPDNNQIVWEGNINPSRARVIRFRVRVDMPLDNGTIITNEAIINDGVNPEIVRTTESIVESPPAHITLTNPMAGEENVSITPNIRVVFDQTMDRASVENAFRVSNSNNQDWTYVWANRDRTVTFSLVGENTLGYLTEYEVEIDPDIARTAKGGVLEAGEIPNPWTFTTAGLEANLSTSEVTVDLDIANPGDFLNYTIRIRNTGLGEDIRVNLTNPIPENTTYAYYVAGARYDETENQIYWNGVVRAGRTKTVRFTVQINETIPKGTIILDESIIEGEGKEPFSKFAETLVMPEVDWETSYKLDANEDSDRAPHTAYPGDILDYTIFVENTGNSDALNVSVLDLIPWRTTYVEDSATGGLVYEEDDNQMSWSGDVGPDENKLFSFKVLLDELSGLFTPPDDTVINEAVIRDLDGNMSTQSTATVVLDNNSTIPNPKLPYLIAVDPEEDETSVKLYEPINLTFSEPIAPESLAYEAYMNDQLIDTANWQIEQTDADSTLTLQPDKPLYSGMVYTISIVEAVDTNGQRLVANGPIENNTWSFTTARPTLFFRESHILNLRAGTVSGLITVELGDWVNYNDPNATTPIYAPYAVEATEGMMVKLWSTSKTGKFDRAVNGQFLNNSIEVMMPYAHSGINFYYTDSVITSPIVYKMVAYAPYTNYLVYAGFRPVITTIDGIMPDQNQIHFTTDSQSVPVDDYSNPIGFELRSPEGLRLEMEAGKTFLLSTNSNTGRFYNQFKLPLDQYASYKTDGGTKLYYKLSLPDETEEAVMYYRDSTPGPYLITVDEDQGININSVQIAANVYQPAAGAEQDIKIVPLEDQDIDPEDIEDELEIIEDETGRELAYVVINPHDTTLVPGSMRAFEAKGYDTEGNLIENLSFGWYVIASGGYIDKINPTNAMFQAGYTPGVYKNTVMAAAYYNGVIKSDLATVIVADVGYTPPGHLPSTGPNGIQWLFIALILVSAVALAAVEHYEKTHFEEVK